MTRMGHTMNLIVGPGAILAYQRLPYRVWYALAEFVDNAVDSYLRPENRERLDSVFAATGGRLEVEVTYDRKTRSLRIDDNSIGMSAPELEAAMVIGQPPISSAGLSEFGMGMKTAAIWFCDIFSIRTTKLGEPDETTVTVNVPDIAAGRGALDVTSRRVDADTHYTVIELHGIRRRLGTASLNKTREYLGSIFREYLRSNEFRLTVDGSELPIPVSRDADAFMRRRDGTPLIAPVDIAIDQKRVTGWVGVLTSGFTGRSRAGFALLRNRRAVNGWIDSWRPEEIFGEARNDLINQRLTGELYLEGFRASHTKDAIDWEDGDEEELGDRLKRLCSEYDLLREARKKVRGSGRSEQEEREHLEALETLRAQLTARAVSDVITFLDVPTPEISEIQAEPLHRILEDSVSPGTVEAVASWRMGDTRVAYLYEVPLSPNDPYFDFEVQQNRDLKVIVNSNHPALQFLDSAEARLAHYHHVVIEAIAEWQVAQQSAVVRPQSIRLMKDRLFRSVAECDDVEP